MSQTYTINCFVATHGGQSDLAIMETNFEALRTTFSGAGAPGDAIAGMQWFDTAQKLLKIRNAANDGWLGVLTGTTSLKMLVYRNTAEDGWAIDGGVTDRVVAIKGGATYTTGGATAGSWTLPDHTLVAGEIPDHAHDGTSDSGGTHTHDVTIMSSGNSANTVARGVDGGPLTASGAGKSGGAHTHTFTTDTDGGGDGSHNHGATYRPAAAVVTIQYPDI